MDFFQFSDILSFLDSVIIKSPKSTSTSEQNSVWLRQIFISRNLKEFEKASEDAEELGDVRTKCEVISTLEKSLVVAQKMITGRKRELHSLRSESQQAQQLQLRRLRCIPVSVRTILSLSSY